MYDKPRKKVPNTTPAEVRGWETKEAATPRPSSARATGKRPSAPTREVANAAATTPTDPLGSPDDNDDDTPEADTDDAFAPPPRTAAFGAGVALLNESYDSLADADDVGSILEKRVGDDSDGDAFDDDDDDDVAPTADPDPDTGVDVDR